MFDAVVCGDESALIHLLSLGASIHSVDDQGLTALHWSAASPEGENLVPYLLSRGAHIDARDIAGITPLHLHCARGRIFGAACLLHQGADANSQTTDSLGMTPLTFATKLNHAEIVRLLLAYGAKASPNDSAKSPSSASATASATRLPTTQEAGETLPASQNIKRVTK